MLQVLRKRIKSQKGFTLIELMFVIAIIGILAAIALPRFANSTAAANTAKIAADLRTIDSAVTMSLAQFPTKTPTLGTAAAPGTLITDGFLAAPPTPPTGNCFINGATPAVAVPGAGAYVINAANAAANPNRAVLGGNVAENFHQ